MGNTRSDRGVHLERADTGWLRQWMSAQARRTPALDGPRSARDRCCLKVFFGACTSNIDSRMTVTAQDRFKNFPSWIQLLRRDGSRGLFQQHRHRRRQPTRKDALPIVRFSSPPPGSKRIKQAEPLLVRVATTDQERLAHRPEPARRRSGRRLGRLRAPAPYPPRPPPPSAAARVTSPARWASPAPCRRGGRRWRGPRPP